MALINCPECGKEVSDKAKKCIHCGKELMIESPKTKVCSECGNVINSDLLECSFCGCPCGDDDIIKTGNEKTKPARNKKKIIVPIVLVLIIAIVGFFIYYLNIVKPENTYNEAITLLEEGDYDAGIELLHSIEDYEDVNVILEQVVYESYAYSCINSLKTYLKNPDSYSPYEILFYEATNEENSKYPICIMHYGAQNGFGGNTTGYAYFTRDDAADEYELVGTCDSLNEDDYDSDDEDEMYDLLICMAINLVKEEHNQLGDIDMQRLKTVLKNDAYSTIKIIE